MAHRKTPKMTHRRPRSKDTDLIVRELGFTQSNTAAIAVGGSEIDDNVQRFFNDTPYNLELVAVRIATLTFLKPAVVQVNAWSVVEISRQAIAGQQEGIIANQRSTASKYAAGAVSGSQQKGEMLFGDFKQGLMTLEVQESLFLHSIINNANSSVAVLAIGDAEHSFGVTLYFRVKSTGY